MYKVFLVEDEIVMREGIRNLIEWEEYGFNFIGEASDGELAWTAIQKQKPDIVITDIKMPFMDGLELSKLIKTNLPKTIVIIISGHDDFSYAKAAINSGVNQYLLKPVSKDQLIEVLLQVKKNKDEELLQEKYTKEFANEVQWYLKSSRRDFLEALTSGKHSVPVLLERAEKLGLNLASERYNVVLLLVELDLINDNTLTIEDIQETIAAKFDEAAEYEVFSVGIDVTFVLVLGTDSDVDYKTEICAEKLNHICEDHPHDINWRVASGQPVSRLSMIKECYLSTRSVLFYKADYDKQQQQYTDSFDEIKENTTLDFNPNNMEASKLDQNIINKFLSNGLHEDIDGFVNSYFSGFGDEAVASTLFRHYIVLNILFVVNAFVEKLGLRNDPLNNDQNAKMDLENALQSVENSKKYISELFARVLSVRNKSVTNKHHSVLANVIDYMEANYDDSELGLNTVAKIANMTPTHFSTIFSRETGKTFIEYLTELRMNKARELLRCSGDSNSQIACKVGYKDPHYFSFLFKKINGCSPRNYRNGVV